MRLCQPGREAPGRYADRAYSGPAEKARLDAGDLLVIDETGMLDQDTARALLTVADECQVRVALIGDRHQLAAVGRGGVLDLAAGQVEPAAHLTLAGVRRFIRTDRTGRAAPDLEYADLTLDMRTGEDPGAVFDALAARDQIQLRLDEAGSPTSAPGSRRRTTATTCKGREPAGSRRPEPGPRGPRPAVRSDSATRRTHCLRGADHTG